MYGMDSMEFLETEYGIITDSYCDVMDSLVKFWDFANTLMGSKHFEAYLHA